MPEPNTPTAVATPPPAPPAATPPADAAGAQAAAQAQQQLQQQINAGQLPTEITVPDGKGGHQTFKAANTAELLQKIADASGNKNAHIARIEAENADFKRQLAAVQQTQQKLKAVFAPDQGPEQSFSQARYLQLLETNALQAQAYVNSFDPAFQATAQMRKQSHLQTIGTVFLSQHPDFPSTPENSELLVSTAIELSGLTDEEVESDPSRLTARHLRAAYRELRDEGKVRPNPNAPVGPTPPPSVAAISGQPTQTEQQIAQEIHAAPTEEARKAVMRKYGYSV